MNSTDKKVLKFNYEMRADWKATMLYYQAKNVIYILKLSGHGNIKNTLLCVTIDQQCLEWKAL
jgi:hypothetical protein